MNISLGSRQQPTSIILIGSLILLTAILVGCNRQMADAGYHSCNDATSEYTLKVLSGKNKGAVESITLKAKDALVYVYPNNKLEVSYKVRDMKVAYKVEYTLDGNLMVGSSSSTETKTDPTTSKEWTLQRDIKILLNNKTGELKKSILENHLDNDGNITSTETYALKAQCDLVSG
jgi:uncharacterized protein YcnI